jgi:hypothetical protein
VGARQGQDYYGAGGCLLCGLGVVRSSKVSLILGFSLILGAVRTNSNSAQPRSAADQVRITNESGQEQTSRPISIPRPFVEGEIRNLAQASLEGTALATQCDVKNRWPDGSLKFAVVSFIIPRIPARGSIVVSFSDQASGNDAGYLTQPDMLSAAYNFDGQIQLKGAVSHSISARSILASAGSCHDPGNDVDSGRYLCTYWLKGPIVTAVILEDRTTVRSQDVNTDGGVGNPLHPIFEAWFYPRTAHVQLGYTLEDSWASTTPTKSARDQTYSLVLTGGASNPVTLYTNETFKHITRSRWHKTFCMRGEEAGNSNSCSGLNADYNWPYLAETRFLPHWDPTLELAASLIKTKVGAFANGARTLEGCSGCYSGRGGIGNFAKGLDAAGAADWHGPLTTWDIIYLISQDPGMYKVMVGNADLGGRIPYFYREADTHAGHGQWFDAPRKTVETFGRVVSINARTEVSLDDATTQNQCNKDDPADWINFGGSGQDTDGWDRDTSHWPNLAYASYLSTGQYAYYEEQIMQSAYAIADSPGTRGCALPPTQASLRQGALGYWDTTEERQQDWLARENALGAFIAIDGSPEKTYFEDKLRTNLAVWEASHDIPCDVPGTGVQEPYCGGSEQSTAWSYGKTVRAGIPQGGTTLGSWTTGVCCCSQDCYVPNPPLCRSGSDCTVPGAANANFQNNYSGLVVGWINDLGYCPHTKGTCQMLQFVENWFINAVEDPHSSPFILSSYVYPTLDKSGAQITSFSQFPPFYAPGNWPPKTFGECGDEAYGAGGVAVLSYGYQMTSNEGFTGSTAYNKARPVLISGCTSGSNANFNGTNGGSPKWDITPRQLGPSPMPTPQEKQRR